MPVPRSDEPRHFLTVPSHSDTPRTSPGPPLPFLPIRSACAESVRGAPMRRLAARLLTKLIRYFLGWCKRKPVTRVRPAATRPVLEALENRQLPGTIIDAAVAALLPLTTGLLAPGQMGP